MLIAGKKHYVFARPSDVGAIFRKPKAFSIRPFIDLVHKRFFNMSPASVEKINTLNASLHKLYEKYLLAPAEYETTVVSYIQDLRIRIHDVDAKAAVVAADGSVPQFDAFNLILDTQALASVVAYFGHKPVEIHPTMTRDMSEFTADGFWPLFAGIPSWLLRSVSRARSRVMQAFLHGFYDPLQENGGVKSEDASAFATEHSKLLASVLDREDVGKLEFSFMFGWVVRFLCLCNLQLSSPSLYPQHPREYFP